MNEPFSFHFTKQHIKTAFSTHNFFIRSSLRGRRLKAGERAGKRAGERGDRAREGKGTKAIKKRQLSISPCNGQFTFVGSVDTTKFRTSLKAVAHEPVETTEDHAFFDASLSPRRRKFIPVFYLFV